MYRPQGKLSRYSSSVKTDYKNRFFPLTPLVDNIEREQSE